MSIVLNEREWAIDMIERNDIGKKPSETLRRVARVYIDDGLKPDAVRKKLADFIMRCTSGSTPYSWDDAISRAISYASKYQAIHIKNIIVSKTEMNEIESLSGKQLQRLAFTLLCLAKYWNQVRHTSDGWVSNKDNEIMQMANIGTSIKRQSMMYHSLKELGLIQFARMVDNTNVKVCFIDDGDPEMIITDLRNLGYQYLMHHGESYFVCANCGITTKSNSRKQKYCKECAAEIAIQQRINSVMRQRRASFGTGFNASEMFTVYMHESPNGKRYVGTTTTTLEHRWKRGLGYEGNGRFWNDIVEFGWDNIKHYRIACVESSDLAKTIEALYIRKYQTTDISKGYNRLSGNVLVDIAEDIEKAYPPVPFNEKSLQLS